MEERRFDAWTRTLGAATSRRQVLKGVLGGVLAVAVGQAVEPVVAEAAGLCGPNAVDECMTDARNQFNSKMQTCMMFGKHGGFANGGYGARIGCTISALTTYRQNARACRSGDGCGANLSCCQQQCFDLETDPFNCGACDHLCPEDARCINSQCVCDAGETVCDNACADLETSPVNCGACGHACDPGVACEDGQCQCDELQTLCNNTCVDTQSDNNNCGSCGNACGDCEQCVAGTCQPLTCDSDRFCCQHACYPKCEHNQPDPQTCQCGFCDSLEDGTTCGPTSVCCQYDCVDTTCPDGRQFNDSTCQCDCTPVECPSGKTQDPTTCQCVCTPVECPTGQSQDSDTCQCVDKCASVTCDTCQTCDPDSGQCVQAPTGTSCGSNLTCCADGSCQTNCSACPDDRVKCGDTCCPTNQVCSDDDTCQEPGGCNPACGPDEICCQGYGIVGDFPYGCVSISEYKICPVVASDQAGASRGSWTCCPIEQSCCGGSGYFYNICGGEDADGVHTCCKPPQTECGPYCCESHANCFVSPNYVDHCCPADSGGVLDDGTCCSPGTEPVNYYGGSQACEPLG